MNTIIPIDYAILLGFKQEKLNNYYYDFFPIPGGQNYFVSSIDKGMMIFNEDQFDGNSWYDANDYIQNKSATALVSNNLRFDAKIFAGTKNDGVYILKIPVGSVEFSDNSSDLTIINSNDQLVKLKLNLTSDDYVNLELFDLQGNKVNDIFNDYLSEGEHKLDLDISGLQSGIYFIKLQLNGETTIKKMIVTR
jgi:hypothetical protein